MADLSPYRQQFLIQPPSGGELLQGNTSQLASGRVNPAYPEKAVFEMMPVMKAAQGVSMAGRLGNMALRGAMGAGAGEVYAPTNNPLQSLAGGALAGAGGQGIGEMLGGAGRAIGAGIGAGLGKMGLTRFAPGAMEAQQTARSVGASLPIAQLLETRPAGVVGTQLKLSQSLQDLVAQYPKPGREGVGDVVQDAIDRGGRTFWANTAKNYRGVDSLANGTMVDFTPVKQEAAKLQAQLAKALQGIEGNQAAAKTLKDILSREDSMSFMDAHYLRSQLLAIERSTDDAIKDRAEVNGGRLGRAVDKAMDDSAKVLNPGALAAWREANAFHSGGLDTWNNKVIRGLVKSEPEAILARLGGNKPGTISKIRNVVGEEDWRNVQGSFLQNAMFKAVDPGTGEISGEALIQFLGRHEADTLAEIFPKSGDISRLRGLAQALRVSQKGHVDGLHMQATPSGVVLLSAAAGAIVGGMPAAAGAAGATSGTIRMSNYAFAKLLNSPSMSRWLSIGITSPAGSDSRRHALSQLTAWVAKNELSQTENAKVVK